MKTGLTIAGIVLAAIVVAGGFYMVDIDQTREAEMPSVDVDVSGGQLPAFDAEVGTIRVTEEEITTTVPEVDVTMEEKTITLPGLDVEPPKNDG